MKKYFLRDGNGEQGPFLPEDLKGKNLQPTTEVREDGQSLWSLAGDQEDLKPITGAEIPAASPEKSQGEKQVPVSNTNTDPKPIVQAPKATGASPKKNMAWVSYLAGVLILSGIGFFIYRDMKRNRVSGTGLVMADPASQDPADPEGKGSGLPETLDTGTNLIVTLPKPDSVLPGPVTAALPDAKKAAEEKKKLIAIQAKKKSDAEKKDQLAEEERKKEEENRKAMIAQAQAEKETEMRNNWARYVTIGGLTLVEKEGIRPFDIPVYNALPAMIEKITLRVDYLKKDGKLLGSENLQLSNVPARGGMNAPAAGHKKAKKANVYITGINSRGMHFCYPGNNGNPADPHFCN